MSPLAEQPELLDAKLLSTFIYELNISRRYISTYPPSHPIIATSSQKVLDDLAKLLEFQESVVIGIARDRLVLANGVLDEKNPVYGNLARAFFDAGITVITFHKRLKLEDLIGFITILGQRREQILARGGVGPLLAEAGISTIEVQGIDYDSFRVTEEESIAAPDRKQPEIKSTGLWGRFVQGIMDGTLDPSGSSSVAIDSIDPEELAALLNTYAKSSSSDKKVSYDWAITSFMREIDQKELVSRHDTESIQKLTSFIKYLSPDVRRQFMESTFGELDHHQHAARKMLEGFPDDIILEALDDVSFRGSFVSPAVMNLLQKMSKIPTDQGKRRSSVALEQLSEQQLGKKLRDIFREDDPDQFVPEAYQKALHAMLDVERVSVLGTAERDQLLQGIVSFPLEVQVASICLEILGSPLAEEEIAPLTSTVIELCGFFLETGDFSSLSLVHRRLFGSWRLDEAPPSRLHQEVLAFFTTHLFVEEVLNGLSFWGKQKYDAIRDLVRTVGSPFVEPMMDRLAEEQSMSLRRYFIGCLLDLGDATLNAALPHLQNSRWYFVRNMVMILAGLNRPEVLTHLRPLVAHPHPKVRLEVLRTCLHYQDPQGERLLIQFLEGGEGELQLAAAQLAEKYQSQRVFYRLVALLSKGGLSAAELELKGALVRALASYADPKALPALQSLLSSRSLLNAGALNRLKMEVVGSLSQYPPDTAIPLLQQISASGRGELAAHATDTLKSIREKS